MLKLTEEGDVAQYVASWMTEARGDLELLAQLSGAWEGAIPG